MISPPPPPPPLPPPISMQSALDQTRYLMWTRRKISTRPPLFNSPMIPMPGAGSSYHDSWEEQAFAEDSSGLLGGCVWPPRSYSCSFCRREFRSAQALGGHMNVHRRDRARLKQSSSPTRDDPEQYQSQISTPDQCYTTNPNPNPNPNPKPKSNSGVDYTLVSPSYVSPTILHEQQIESAFSIPRSLTDPLPVRVLNVPDLKLGIESWRLMEVGSTLGKRNSRDDEEIMNIGNSKRCRIDPSFSSIAKPVEVLKLGSTPAEELDLELRLGDPPKVK